MDARDATDARDESGPARTKAPTRAERTSDREMVVKRTFNAPARMVFEAWTNPKLFVRWWAPKSLSVPILSCEMDVRTGGKYRLEFGKDSSNTWTFFGRYIEVTPPSKLVWTNEEEEAGAVTTVTFEERDGQTLLTLRELYPTKEALDQFLEEGLVGMEDGMTEQFEQLDALLVELTAGAGSS